MQQYERDLEALVFILLIKGSVKTFETSASVETAKIKYNESNIYLKLLRSLRTVQVYLSHNHPPTSAQA